METVINSGSLSQWGSAVEDRKISRVGDSLSEHNQGRGAGTQRYLKGTHRYRSKVTKSLCWVLSSLAATKWKSIYRDNNEMLAYLEEDISVK